MNALSTNNIWYAIQALEREAQFRWNVGGRDNIDRYRELQDTIKRANAEYSALSTALPRLRDLKTAADRAYDAYVTREPECCSCHISAPCGWCTSQTDDEEQSA